MNKDSGKTTPKKNKECDEKPIDSPAAEECKQNLKVHPISLPQIPPLLPLLHSEMQEACMLLCLQLLGLKSRKGLIDTTYLERMCPPPVILNGVFFSSRQSHVFCVIFISHTYLSILFKSSKLFCCLCYGYFALVIFHLCACEWGELSCCSGCQAAHFSPATDTSYL